MIPIMPFHTILKNNFCFIPLFLGKSPNLHTKSKGLNMAGSARGPAQMLAYSSSAPAASTRQLRDRSEGQTPTTSSLLFLWPSASSKRDEPSWDSRSPFQPALQSLAWGSCPGPYSLLENKGHPSFSLARPWCCLKRRKKHDLQLGPMTLTRHIFKKNIYLKNPEPNMAKWLTGFLPAAFDPLCYKAG